MTYTFVFKSCYYWIGKHMLVTTRSNSATNMPLGSFSMKTRNVNQAIFLSSLNTCNIYQITFINTLLSCWSFLTNKPQLDSRVQVPKKVTDIQQIFQKMILSGIIVSSVLHSQYLIKDVKFEWLLHLKRTANITFW